MGTPALAADRSHRPASRPAPAAHRFAQIGMKLWADGSPWQGNIATSFPYLDTDATRAMGLGSCHHGAMNYTAEQLHELAGAFAEQGWPLACHVHGDVAIDVVLDAYEAAAARTGGEDRRPRLEHCGAMRPDQYERAAGLGVTVSLFIQHLWYWGDVLVDGLFGPEHGGRWMAARSALDAGVRISLHNDGMVTPPDPLGNIATAVNRRTKGSGRVIGAEQCISVDAGAAGSDDRRRLAAVPRPGPGHHRDRKARRPGRALGRPSRGGTGRHRRPGRGGHVLGRAADGGRAAVVTVPAH